MNTRIIKWMVLGIAGLLAAMGLLFTWKCPVDCIFGVDSGVFFFKKQLLWNVIGIAACIGAALVPWRKWLKFAPWGLMAWFALAVWALGFSPARHGSHRWADFGVVCVNVRVALIAVSALFAAWLCSKKCIKPWMVFAAIGVFLVFAAFQVLGNANRLARLAVFFGGEEANAQYKYMQFQMKAAYAAAHWSAMPTAVFAFCRSRMPMRCRVRRRFFSANGSRSPRRRCTLRWEAFLRGFGLL